MHIPKLSREPLLAISLIIATLLLTFCEHDLGTAPTKKKKKNTSISENDSSRRRYEFELIKSWSFGYENYKNNQFESAIKHFWRLVQMDTIRKYDSGYCYLADCYAKLNNPDSAKYVYELGMPACSPFKAYGDKL